MSVNDPNVSIEPLSQNPASSSKPARRSKPQLPNGPPADQTFGARVLTDEDPFSHNAWDHASLPDDFDEQAAAILEKQRAKPVDAGKKESYNKYAASYWDKFYGLHKDAFFKDRNWLHIEFPELVACASADAGPKVVLEIGCGAGNTVFPLMAQNENPDLIVYACDYSKTAVDVVKRTDMFPVPAHGKGRIHASVWDLSTPSTPEITNLPEGIEPGTVDVITMIYVLSALHPDEWKDAMANVWKCLKPGGLVLIRDYGRHDLAQLRIKGGRMLDENFYIRGDGTRVYFFTSEELSEMLTGDTEAYKPFEVSPPVVKPKMGEDDVTASTPDVSTPTQVATPAEAEEGLDSLAEQLESLKAPSSEEHKSSFEPFKRPNAEFGVPDSPLFGITQLGVDKRLLVNRKLRMKMYRIWMQVKARKLPLSVGEEQKV